MAREITLKCVTIMSSAPSTGALELVVPCLSGVSYFYGSRPGEY